MLRRISPWYITFHLIITLYNEENLRTHRDRERERERERERLWGNHVIDFSVYLCFNHTQRMFLG